MATEKEIKEVLVARYWAWIRADEQERLLLKMVTLDKLIDSCTALAEEYKRMDKDGHS